MSKLAVRTWEFQAKVVTVDSGDRITVDVEASPWSERLLTINLADIKAPSLDEDKGRVARDALSVMLPKGATFRVVGYHFEKYNTLKAIIYHPDIAMSVNNWMVASGYAVPV